MKLILIDDHYEGKSKYLPLIVIGITMILFIGMFEEKSMRVICALLSLCLILLFFILDRKTKPYLPIGEVKLLENEVNIIKNDCAIIIEANNIKGIFFFYGGYSGSTKNFRVFETGTNNYLLIKEINEKSTLYNFLLPNIDSLKRLKKQLSLMNCYCEQKPVPVNSAELYTLISN
jgi:hypothetical protein